MTFTYTSTRGFEKELPPELVAQVRAHLVACGFHRGMTVGEVDDMFRAFRKPDGGCLMSHQIAPMLVYITPCGELWPESSHPPATVQGTTR